MRLFFALAASLNYVFTFADTKNAFQQSPPPSCQCYLQPDPAYCSWYFKQFGKQIDPKTHVIPILKSLQGHPASGYQWETMINDILIDKLSFTSTVHKCNLYIGKYNNTDILICQQVDDYAIATPHLPAAPKLIKFINSHVTTEHLGQGLLTEHGTHTQYNGIDVHQTCNYIKLSCETYIDCLLLSHGWTTPEKGTSDCHDLTPLSTKDITSLQQFLGPAEGTKEH